MTRHTIVIDFADADQPSYGAGMEVLGGKVVAVAFADEMERAEQLEAEIEILKQRLAAAAITMENCELFRKDAERYQWLRNRIPGSAYRIAGVIYSEGGEGVDAAVDAARAIADT